MMIIQHIFVSLLLIITTQSFAEKMLVPPNSQAPECNYSYNDAAQPKTADNVLSAMRPICIKRGGLRVMHKILTSESSNEPTGIILNCIGDNPNMLLFHCSFSTSYENL